MPHTIHQNYSNIKHDWQQVLNTLDKRLLTKTGVTALGNLGFGLYDTAGIESFIAEMNVLHGKERPEENYINCHIYIGLLSTSLSHPRHGDPTDVYYVQALGRTIWHVYENTGEVRQYELGPGDMIFIEKGTEHKVESYGPRVGLSIGFL